MNKNTTNRLVELDALRGIAAVLVMLFHYTAKYEELYGHESAPAISLPWGHYGVNLFFMISGFVIFMTLHRIGRPLDFVVSRFSRLFPAFWVAVAITFLLTHLLGLPDKTVSASTAGLNLFMIHGLFRIPHVDSVYWTLEIELIFYAMALSMYLAGWIDRVHTALLGLLVLRSIYFLTQHFAGIELSWTLSHLLILPYIAWFACGIMIYRIVTFPSDTPRMDFLVLFAAFAQLAIVEGPGIGLLAAGLSLVFWAAATGRLPWLANPLLAWLGAISYTLYLLHENIGWGIILQLERNGISANWVILIAISAALGMASLLTLLVERPAMRWMRERYRRQRHWPDIGWRLPLAATCILLLTLAGLAHTWHHTHPKPQPPAALVANIYRPSDLSAVPCGFGSDPRPLMILVLGQSNAGNHGDLATPPSRESTTFFFEGRCYRTQGSAPGATGRGGNPWTLLGPELVQATGRPVIFAVLAVESTRIRDWVEPGILRQTLISTIAEQRQHGFIPDFVLWQQGEADTKAGTTQAKYRERFDTLVALLRAGGILAPVVAALSTRCHNNGSNAIRSAIETSAASNSSIRIGPDTDILSGSLRADNCHFSAKGLQVVSQLWQAVITKKSAIMQ